MINNKSILKSCGDAFFRWLLLHFRYVSEAMLGAGAQR